ncbi:MAG: hypothetical protein MR821_06025 [Clostridiales bacterium]|nr:hypothetical protein [Clostridiales bacterium]
MRLRVRPAFVVYLASMALLASPACALGAVCALAVHELGHALAARLLGERICTVELAPFGGVMTYAPGYSPAKGLRGIALAAAGPLGNELALLLLGVATRSELLCSLMNGELLRQMIGANAAMLALNLLPALPLDGGRIVFCAGYYLFGVSALSLLLCALGTALGLLLCSLAVYGALALGTLNLSLMIVGGYLTVCAVQGRDALLSENLYAVVHERMQSGGQRCARAVLLRVGGETPLYALIPHMAKTRACVLVLEEGGAPVLLGEEAVLCALLENPAQSVREAAAAPDIQGTDAGENAAFPGRI